MTQLSTSSHGSVDRGPAQFTGSNGFDSCLGLIFFLCPMHHAYFITELTIHHLYLLITTHDDFDSTDP